MLSNSDEDILIAGIDPGLDGAIAQLVGGSLVIDDMPTFEITTNGKKRRQLDLASIARIFGTIQANGCELVCIEEPSAQPKDGVIQAFKFGFNCCAPQAMAAAFHLPVKLVRPNVWKSSFGLTADKDLARKRASEIMPKFSHLWPLKRHDGRAEAALLALYGARHA